MANAIENTDATVALVIDNIIAYNNAAFCELCGDKTNQKIDTLFNPEQAEQLQWLMCAASSEYDKVILPMSIEQAKSINIMVQFWPIQSNVFLFSLSRHYLIERQADIDTLTHLHTRSKAKLLLEMEVARASRFSGFCLAVGDIDFFKSVNDTYGHDMGDQVLCHVAQVMSSVLRGGDWVARWGGEEFLIFISGDDLVTGMQPINRINKVLNSTPFEGNGCELSVTMSFGLVSSANGGTIQEMIQRADILMYEAKQNGRNRCVWEKGENRLWVMDDILQSIENNHIVPIYSPIYDWENRIVAVHVAHGLEVGDSVEVEKMLSAANRLQKRTDVDWTLINGISNERLINMDVPHFIPLSSSLVDQDIQAVLRFFERSPFLHAGISIKSPLSDANINSLASVGVPIVLLDFDPHKVPVHFLAYGGIHYIVCTNSDTLSQTAMPLLTSVAQCYADLPDSSSLSPESMAVLQKNGFAGFLHRSSSQKYC